MKGRKVMATHTRDNPDLNSDPLPTAWLNRLIDASLAFLCLYCSLVTFLLSSSSGLSICGHNCLLTAEWMSASKIVCRVGPAKDDKGEIIVTTKSGGLGTSTVSFRLLKPERIGELHSVIHGLCKWFQTSLINLTRHCTSQTFQKVDVFFKF